VQIYKTKIGELFYLSSQKKAILGLTLPSPLERVQNCEVKILSFGEDYSLFIFISAHEGFAI
jgi:hypothetical protein